MAVWFFVTVVLLIWNAIYCGMRTAADFRGPKPANGVWGLFALAGALSMIVMGLAALASSVSGI